jgi:hypothetical protein
VVAFDFTEPSRPVRLFEDDRHAVCNSDISAFGVVVKMVKLRVTV